MDGIKDVTNVLLSASNTETSLSALVTYTLTDACDNIGIKKQKAQKVLTIKINIPAA
jgi:hypothetical protein